MINKELNFVNGSVKKYVSNLDNNLIYSEYKKLIKFYRTYNSVNYHTVNNIKISEKEYLEKLLDYTNYIEDYIDKIHGFFYLISTIDMNDHDIYCFYDKLIYDIKMIKDENKKTDLLIAVYNRLLKDKKYSNISYWFLNDIFNYKEDFNYFHKETIIFKFLSIQDEKINKLIQFNKPIVNINNIFSKIYLNIFKNILLKNENLIIDSDTEVYELMKMPMYEKTLNHTSVEFLEIFKNVVFYYQHNMLEQEELFKEYYKYFKNYNYQKNIFKSNLNSSYISFYIDMMKYYSEKNNDLFINLFNSGKSLIGSNYEIFSEVKKILNYEQLTNLLKIALNNNVKIEIEIILENNILQKEVLTNLENSRNTIKKL